MTGTMICLSDLLAFPDQKAITGVVHQILSPISNSEATNFSYEYRIPRIVSAETILFWNWKFSYSFRIMVNFYFINWILAVETIEGGNYSWKYGRWIFQGSIFFKNSPRIPIRIQSDFLINVSFNFFFLPVDSNIFLFWTLLVCFLWRH